MTPGDGGGDKQQQQQQRHILQRNYLNKIMYSPDYKGIDTERVFEWVGAGGVG